MQFTDKNGQIVVIAKIIEESTMAFRFADNIDATIADVLIGIDATHFHVIRDCYTKCKSYRKAKLSLLIPYLDELELDVSSDNVLELIELENLF